MKPIKIAMMSCLIVLAGLSGMAQTGRLNMGINYSFGLPIGSLTDAMPDNSPRGWNGNIHYALTENIYAGLGIGYQDFYYKSPRQLYKTGDGSDISAVMTRSIQTIPILAQGRYVFAPQASVQPYVGLGVGGSLIRYRRFLGEFGESDTKFSFAARPEAGINIPVGRNRETGINVSAAYHYIPFKHDGVESLSHLGINVGIRFPLRR
ncbi:MAG TPA: OmpW family outer membrane protein [Flavitalea sp.]|nr:OmpW family outer membrane protein [Flavitalea sp.]